MYIFIWEQAVSETQTIIFKSEGEAKAAINEMRVRDLPDLVVSIGNVIAGTQQIHTTTVSGKEFVNRDNDYMTTFLAQIRARFAA